MASNAGRGDTREQILNAAISEFSQKGLDGARVDQIAAASRVNKNMIYHYFNSKEELFIAALEEVYQTVRSRQQDFRFRDMDPADAMRSLIEFTAEVWYEMPEFTRLLNSENLHEARHVRKSTRIVEMYNPLLENISTILRKGQEKGQFRAGVDPIDLYISITALSAYYVSHRHTFEAVFQRPLMTPERFAQRKAHVAEVIMSYLQDRPDSARSS